MQRLATATSSAIVEVDGLVKRFGGLTALDGISLSIQPGSVYGLMGSNGAGKTTLIRTLLGLTRPTAGRVMVLGHDMETDAKRIRPRIGYVPENQHLYSWMTVETLLGFVRAFYPTWNQTLCDSLLALFKINSQQKIKQLSKGTVVKLALVIAVAHEPQLLILDEPTSGLDPLVRADLLEVLAERHRATGHAILFSSHILSDIEALADQVGILHAGRFLASGSIERLQRSLRMIRVSLPADGRPVAPPAKTLWQTRHEQECCLAVADYDEAVLEEVKAKNQVSVIGVRGVTLDEVYLYHVRGNGRHAAATVVERRPA